MDVPQIPGYDVLARIGVGASAHVWRARRVADDLDVALKVLPTGPEYVSAALREAGVLARVRHQHVIHLYDVLPVPQAGGRPGGVALAMELAGGGSLAEVLGARTHLTPGELVTVCSPLAGALAELHRVGVVHGDISPGNVLFRSDGMPLLADLGVSRIVGERRGEAYGTDGMVAPEVLEGFPPSAESDVYAMGALAWRCLVGEVPGWVGTRTALRELRPELPEALVDLVTACLAADPSDRPEAEELAVALFAAARPEPVELAPGADPAAGLTQRIRADLGRGSVAGDAASGRGAGGGGARVGGAGGGGAPVGEAPGAVRRRPHPRALHRAPQRRDRGLVGRTLAGVAIGLLAVMAVGGVAVPWVKAMAFDDDTGADDGGQVAATAQLTESAAATAEVPDEPTTGASASGAPAPGEATPEAEPSAEAEPPAESQAPAEAEPPAEAERSAAEAEPSADADLEPDQDPVAAAQALLDARAAAWRSGDPADLAGAHAMGSPAYEQETAALESARELGVRYEGLAFTVEDATVLEAEDERVLLEVEVLRSAFEEVTPARTVPRLEQADVVELQLRRVDDGWRIWGWG